MAGLRLSASRKSSLLCVVGEERLRAAVRPDFERLDGPGEVGVQRLSGRLELPFLGFEVEAQALDASLERLDLREKGSVRLERGLTGGRELRADGAKLRVGVATVEVGDQPTTRSFWSSSAISSAAILLSLSSIVDLLLPALPKQPPDLENEPSGQNEEGRGCEELLLCQKLCPDEDEGGSCQPHPPV